MAATSSTASNTSQTDQSSDDEDLSTISDDFESMSIQSSTEDSQNEQSCSSRYILILFNFDQKFDPFVYYECATNHSFHLTEES